SHCTLCNSTLLETPGDDEKIVLLKFLQNITTSSVWVRARRENVNLYGGLFDFKLTWESTNSRLQSKLPLYDVIISNTTDNECVLMNANNTTFYNEACDQENAFVCARVDPCSPFMESSYLPGRCLVLVRHLATWNQSKAFCESFHGGSLAELIFEEERSKTFDLINYFSWCDAAWIALTNIRSDRHFGWAYSQARAINIPWGNAEPNNNLGIDHCVEAVQSRTLNDNKCDTNREFICDIEINYLEPATDACYPWQIAAYNNGTCVKLFDVQITWQKAQKFCEKFGGKLFEMSTPEKSVFVITLYNGIAPGKDVWVGARQTDNEFNWTSNAETVFSNWLADGVQQLSGDTTESCLYLSNGRLYVTQCNSEKSFICEKGENNVCPNRLYNKGKCLKCVDILSTWNDAQKECWNQGGLLAEQTTIADASELLSKYKVWAGKSKNMLWNSITRDWTGENNENIKYNSICQTD
ncbi:macrophage mannose receptor 1, partial [Biomphalaria glabrata]